MYVIVVLLNFILSNYFLIVYSIKYLVNVVFIKLYTQDKLKKLNLKEDMNYTLENTYY